MTAPVFYDPHQRRWRWFTRLGRAIGIFASLALIAVVGTVLVNPALPGLGLPPVAPLPQHRLLAARIPRMTNSTFSRDIAYAVSPLWPSSN